MVKKPLRPYFWGGVRFWGGRWTCHDKSLSSPSWCKKLPTHTPQLHRNDPPQSRWLRQAIPDQQSQNRFSPRRIFQPTTNPPSNLKDGLPEYHYQLPLPTNYQYLHQPTTNYQVFASLLFVFFLGGKCTQRLTDPSRLVPPLLQVPPLKVQKNQRVATFDWWKGPDPLLVKATAFKGLPKTNTFPIFRSKTMALFYSNRFFSSVSIEMMLSPVCCGWKFTDLHPLHLHPFIQLHPICPCQFWVLRLYLIFEEWL